MKVRVVNLLVIMLFASFHLMGQAEKKLVREGNAMYEEGNFQEAEIEYRKALDENPTYMKGKFNLGDAMYEQENYEASGKIFNELGESAPTAQAKASSWYNMGNSLMKQQKFQESIEAFKNALRLNPDDQDAKYNLEYARKMLNNQQQQQNQDQNQDENQDQENQNQNQDQQNKDQEQKEQDQHQENQQDQQQSQQEQEDQQQQQNQQPQPQQISREDAQRMLDALKNDEKKTLQELQEQKAKAVKARKSEIDW